MINWEFAVKPKTKTKQYTVAQTQRNNLHKEARIAVELYPAASNSGFQVAMEEHHINCGKASITKGQNILQWDVP